MSDNEEHVTHWADPQSNCLLLKICELNFHMQLADAKLAKQICKNDKYLKKLLTKRHGTDTDADFEPVNKNLPFWALLADDVEIQKSIWKKVRPLRRYLSDVYPNYVQKKKNIKLERQQKKDTTKKSDDDEDEHDQQKPFEKKGKKHILIFDDDNNESDKDEEDEKQYGDNDIQYNDAHDDSGDDSPYVEEDDETLEMYSGDEDEGIEQILPLHSYEHHFDKNGNWIWHSYSVTRTFIEQQRQVHLELASSYKQSTTDTKEDFDTFYDAMNLLYSTEDYSSLSQQDCQAFAQHLFDAQLKSQRDISRIRCALYELYRILSKHYSNSDTISKQWKNKQAFLSAMLGKPAITVYKWAQLYFFMSDYPLLLNTPSDMSTFVGERGQKLHAYYQSSSGQTDGDMWLLSNTVCKSTVNNK
jgi:hypothetical protein